MKRRGVRPVVILAVPIDAEASSARRRESSLDYRKTRKRRICRIVFGCVAVALSSAIGIRRGDIMVMSRRLHEDAQSSKRRILSSGMNQLSIGIWAAHAVERPGCTSLTSVEISLLSIRESGYGNIPLLIRLCDVKHGRQWPHHRLFGAERVVR